MQDFTRLIVWQRAQTFTVQVYSATERFDRRAMAGMRSQLRRASASIAANIAEGAGAVGAPQFARYLQLAISSASEVESHLDLAARLAVLDSETLASLITEAQALRRMLVTLRKRVIEQHLRSS